MQPWVKLKIQVTSLHKDDTSESIEQAFKKIGFT